MNWKRHLRWRNNVLRRLFWPLETILIKSGIFLEKMVHKENQHLSMDDLEQASALQDISHMPARVKCAVLGWRTLREALEKTTE